MHKANLSYDRLLFYLAELEKKGLISKNEGGEKAIFSITLKGKKYLAEFKRFEEFGDAFGVEI